MPMASPLRWDVDMDPPTIVVTAHPPLLAELLSRVLVRPRGACDVEVIGLDRPPNPDAVHVLHLPETPGDPAWLLSPDGKRWMVLTTLAEVTRVVDELRSRA